MISFLEWLQFCVPGPGRDETSFNCAGRHGLQSCAAAADDTLCGWCKKPWPRGARMFSCRECDCDACLACAVLHLETCSTRIFCQRGAADISSTSASAPSCALCEPPLATTEGAGGEAEAEAEAEAQGTGGRDDA